MYYGQPNNLLIVSDYGDQRILQFSLNNLSSAGLMIAGGNGYGCSMTKFRAPIGVALDNSGRLYVADVGCYRVVIFPSNSNSMTSGTVIASVNAPEQLCINSLISDLYVVSYDDNAVYKFVGGGSGYGNALNQLAGPNDIYYDYLYTNSLYVVDTGNSRVLKFPSGSTSATSGTVVAGENSAGSAANQLNDPRTTLVDSNGAIYISDGNNNRVQRWLAGTSSGATIVGGTSETASNQLNFPETILFDKNRKLLVVGRVNNRIQLFNLTTC